MCLFYSFMCFKIKSFRKLWVVTLSSCKQYQVWKNYSKFILHWHSRRLVIPPLFLAFTLVLVFWIERQAKLNERKVTTLRNSSLLRKFATSYSHGTLRALDTALTSSHLVFSGHLCYENWKITDPPFWEIKVVVL